MNIRREQALAQAEEQERLEERAAIDAHFRERDEARKQTRHERIQAKLRGQRLPF